VTAILAMGGLTYGAIEAGAVGLTAGRVLSSFAIAVLALIAFLAGQAHGAHPMVPPSMFRSRAASIPVAIGFAFVAGYYGLPFVMSLYLQQQRGLNALGAGLVFLPMMLVGLVVTPLSARIGEAIGVRRLVVTGLVVMTVGLIALAVLSASTPVPVLAVVMTLVGLGGPLVMPPITAVLLDSVPAHLAGTASGVFNTSRQVGGALAIAIFGALLAGPGGFMHGLRISLLMAAAVALTAAISSRWLTTQPARYGTS
jgi:MFS transporter, DHA2 family, methylenomycin A resistance protein